MRRKHNDIPGALYGSRLIEQPHVKPEVDFTRAFLGGAFQNFVEIGFDHGFRLVDTAQRNPKWHCLGLEVRQRRVEEVSSLAKGLGIHNLHAWRMDARTVVARVIEDGCIDALDILYPTPWWDSNKRAKRLLVQPSFVNDLARILKVEGVVRLETDVEEYAKHIEATFQSHQSFHRISRSESAQRFPDCEVHSRRQKKQFRDGLPQWCLAYQKLGGSVDGSI